MNKLSSTGRRHRRRGIALVITLCFVVLLTGLVVAYFSRAMTDRQLSNASASATTADALARSATDTILGDFREEIVAGSTVSTPSPLAPSGSVIVCVPTTPTNMLPQHNAALASPSPTVGPTVGPIPNLIRTSARSDKSSAAPGYVPAPAVTSHASAASSATASINGRYVSAPRWNKHGLMPAVPTSAPTPAPYPSTPITSFTPPDWVMVTAEEGPTVLTDPNQDANGKKVTVIGRYAYSVYDEGGLLDVNHMGFPSASTFAQVGAKLAPSYADLTQLPSPSSPIPAGAGTMTYTAMDSLLAWRNYATLQASGSFPNVSLSSAAPAAYYNLLAFPTTSSLQVPPNYYGGKTDQNFLSRQQLINYFTAANLDTSYLQYLTTFSRSLNQPSYAPEPSRPKPNAQANGGNNSSGNPNINPSFLNVRVVNGKIGGRNDGTDLIAGEPLVKKRFDLNRLAWLTYKGPSYQRSMSDPDMIALTQAGITTDFLKQGTDANVLSYFGLQWDYNSHYWTYVHNNGAAILNLSNGNGDVAHSGREADFFELLKAAVNTGSIAKSAINGVILTEPAYLGTRSAQNQYLSDTSLDTAILQMGANIIDQFDTDSFPTHIACSLGSLIPVQVYGVENLPYITRVRCSLIRLVEAVPAEAPASSTPVTSQAAFTDTGVAAQLNFPELWNPHDYSSYSQNDPSSHSAGAAYPVNFKVFATTTSYDANGTMLPVGDTSGQKTNSVYANGVAYQAGGGGKVVNPDGTTYVVSSSSADPANSPGFVSKYHFPSFGSGAGTGAESQTLSEANTKMTFTIDPKNGGLALFREPTILCQPGYPSGSNLASPAIASADNSLGALAQNTAFFKNGGLVSVAPNTFKNPPVNGVTFSSYSYIGFYFGSHPLRWWWDGGTANGKTLPAQAVAATQTWYGPNAGGYQANLMNTTYTLACEDGNGGWIAYDNKSVSSNGAPNASLDGHPLNGFGLDGTGAALNGAGCDYGVRYYETIDPRTSRFGMMDPWIDNSNYNCIPPYQSYWINQNNYVGRTTREGANSGVDFRYNTFTTSNSTVYSDVDWHNALIGWYHDSDLASHSAFRPGLLSQNNPTIYVDGITTSVGSAYNITGKTFPPFYYADPDTVVRRASGGNVPSGTTPTPASTTTGLPMAAAAAQLAINSSQSTAKQIDSRPVVLNRPFQSVTELGYTFSGTPWKNLDFFLPESGDVALLDVFCVGDSSDSKGMMAGQTNLNTRQVPVLRAILAQTNKDVWNAATTGGTIASPGNTPNANYTVLGGSGSQADTFAQLLVTRTAVGPAAVPGGPVNIAGPQPLQNISDLVGKWIAASPLKGDVASNAPYPTFPNAGINGQASCDGFTADLANAIASPNTTRNIQRVAEGTIRALVNAGQTRVWNLMFDIVAQSGRYTTQATGTNSFNVASGQHDYFNVEGEQHYWVHVAIDRYTGQVLDRQIEVVKE